MEANWVQAFSMLSSSIFIKDNDSCQTAIRAASYKEKCTTPQKILPLIKKYLYHLPKLNSLLLTESISHSQNLQMNFHQNLKKKLSSYFIDHHSYTTLSSHFQRAILKNQMILSVHHTALKKSP